MGGLGQGASGALGGILGFGCRVFRVLPMDQFMAQPVYSDRTEEHRYENPD